MNLARPFHFWFILALAGSASGLTLNVKQNVKLDSQGKTNDTKTQTRSLDVTITSLENSTVKAEVRWWFFAREQQSGKESIFKKGSKTATLEKLVPVTLQSDPVSTTYVEEHTEIQSKKGGGKKKGHDNTIKKIPASGDRITGYAVQVLIDRKIEAEYYSQPSYKSLVH